MLGWDIYEDDDNINVIPEGEENMHFPDSVCACCPSRSKRDWDEKPIFFHASYDGREIYEQHYETPYHRIRQIRDC